VSKTHKQQEQASILLFALANTCVIATLIAGWDHFAAFVSEVSKVNGAFTGRSVSVPTIAGLIAGVASRIAPRKLVASACWRVRCHRISCTLSHLRAPPPSAQEFAPSR